MSSRMLAPLLALLLLAAPALFAASSGGSSGGSAERADTEERAVDEAEQIFRRGMELVEEERYEDALDRFRKAARKRKDDPDVLNMIAYCYRKTGNLEDAFEHYRKAIGLRPRFPQAREYLGEAHVQAALLQIEILRGYGKDGEKELARLVAALRGAAETLSAEPVGGRGRTGGASDW